MVSTSTGLAVCGVALGVAALTIVMRVKGGFQEGFREKVLGGNGDVLVLKYSIDFREYRDVMKKMRDVPGVVGVAPFVINPMMVTHGDRTATGVLLKGVDPELMPKVLDLPRHVVEGSLLGLRQADAKPPERVREPLREELDRPRAISDAGPDSLLRRIEQEVEAELRAAEATPTGKPRDAAFGGGAPNNKPGAGGAPNNKPGARGAPNNKPRAGAPNDKRGTAARPGTPEGVYRSKLPHDDYLPESVHPDPCS